MFLICPGHRLCRLTLLGSVLVLIIPVWGHGNHGKNPELSHVDFRNPVLQGNKGGGMVVFFMVPFLSTLVPWFIRESTACLNYMLLFGAGLFFTLAIEHLIGHSAAGFHYLLPEEDYPYAYMLVVAGFILTMFADTVAHYVLSRADTKKTYQPPPNAPPLEEKRNTAYMTGHVQLDSPHADTPRVQVPGQVPASYHDHHHHSRADISKLHLGDLILLVLALCFHSIFEGLVVGLAASVARVWSNTGTIVIHKIFEGLALGTSLKSDEGRTFLSLVLYAAAFSISAPVGIAVGMILGSSVDGTTTQWVEAVGNAVAAGVFIFVSICHLLPKALEELPGELSTAGFTKWLAFAIGTAITSLIMMAN